MLKCQMNRKEIAVTVRYCCNGFHRYFSISGFRSVSVVKNPPAMQETWVQSLGQEDPLEEGMAAHSSILAQRIPRTEEPGRLQSTGLLRVKQNLATEHAHVNPV